MDESYEYVKAIVSGGELRWEYKLFGADVVGRQGHDEDVSDWSDREIVDLTCNMLDVDHDNRSAVTVEYS